MFNNAIPQPTQQINQSQPLLLENNRVLGTVIGPNDGTIQFTTSVAQPIITGAMGLYSFLNPQTANIELYVNQQIGGMSFPFPLTSFEIQNTMINGQAATQGWFYLPNGFLVQFGQFITRGNANTTVTFLTNTVTHIAIPTFNPVYNIQITPTFNGGGLGSQGYVTFVTSYTNTQFIVFNGSESVIPRVFYFAFGKV